jgi:hypothetical protein
MRFESNHCVIEILYEYIRAVKTCYSAHLSFGLPQTGLKIPDKIWAAKTMSEPGPIRAFGLAHFLFILFLKFVSAQLDNLFL